MSSYERRTRFILLNCNHKVEIAEPIPDTGSEQYCIRCGLYKFVAAHLVNYRAKCKAKCTYSRNFGDDQDKAMAFARKHVNSKPRHTVEVFRDSDKLAEVNNVGEDLFSTHEEMRANAKESVALLKRVFPGTEQIAEIREEGFPF